MKQNYVFPYAVHKKYPGMETIIKLLNIILFSSNPRNVFKYSSSKLCGQYKSKQISMELGYNVE